MAVPQYRCLLPVTTNSRRKAGTEGIKANPIYFLHPFFRPEAVRSDPARPEFLRENCPGHVFRAKQGPEIRISSNPRMTWTISGSDPRLAFSPLTLAAKW
jgi:hypothetical protein